MDKSHPVNCINQFLLKKIFSAIIIIMMSGWMFQHSQATANEIIRAGWIDSFEGPAKNYAVFRNGQKLSVRYLMQLQEGDRVEVQALGGMIRIRLGEREIVDLNHGLAPFVVPAPNDAPTAWGNLMVWAEKWFSEFYSESPPARQIVAVSRGDTELTSGLLLSENVLWPTGWNTIALAWKGGTPPFNLKITTTNDDKEKKKILDKDGIYLHEYLTKKLLLNSEKYLINITDSSNRSWKTYLILISPESIPKFPDNTISRDLPQEARITLEAAWLANQDEGWQWRLIAYQKLEVLKGYPPAAKLRQALIENSELPKIPWESESSN